VGARQQPRQMFLICACRASSSSLGSTWPLPPGRCGRHRVDGFGRGAWGRRQLADALVVAEEPQRRTGVGLADRVSAEAEGAHAQMVISAARYLVIGPFLEGSKGHGAPEVDRQSRLASQINGFSNSLKQKCTTPLVLSIIEFAVRHIWPWHRPHVSLTCFCGRPIAKTHDFMPLRSCNGMSCLKQADEGQGRNVFERSGPGSRRGNASRNSRASVSIQSERKTL
jgi:hypothetical protein